MCLPQYTPVGHEGIKDGAEGLAGVDVVIIIVIVLAGLGDRSLVGGVPVENGLDNGELEGGALELIPGEDGVDVGDNAGMQLVQETVDSGRDRLLERGRGRATLDLSR